jgi:hypothetical protein
MLPGYVTHQVADGRKTGMNVHNVVLQHPVARRLFSHFIHHLMCKLVLKFTFLILILFFIELAR